MAPECPDVGLAGRSWAGHVAHIRMFRPAIRDPDNGHSLSAIFPGSSSSTGYFEKEQSGNLVCLRLEV